MATIQTTECIEGFQRWLSEPQYSNPQNTIRAYSSDIRMFFFEWRVESFQPEDLNNLAAAWLKWSREVRNLSASTICRRRASIRSLAKYIEMEGPVLQHFRTPTIGQRIPHPLPHLEEDLVRLIEVAKDDAERALVGCLGYEGMRMHEALAQPLGKIDFAGGAINVIGKGDKERRIPITKNGSSYIMPQYIKAMCMSQPMLLAYGDRTARNIITSMGERADIRNRDGSPRSISSHDLRATFATVVYRDTKDIRLVQVLLGHADVSTTQIYIELSFEQMREAVG
jgi:site-specific recombinase XerD